MAFHKDHLYQWYWYNKLCRTIAFHKEFNYFSYADDFTIVTQISKRSMNANINALFTDIINWSSYSGAKLSISKCKHLHICRKANCNFKINSTAYPHKGSWFNHNQEIQMEGTHWLTDSPNLQASQHHKMVGKLEIQLRYKDPYKPHKCPYNDQNWLLPLILRKLPCFLLKKTKSQLPFNLKAGVWSISHHPHQQSPFRSRIDANRAKVLNVHQTPISLT